MSRAWIFASITLAAVLALGAYIASERQPAHPPRTGPAPSSNALTRLPDFTLPDLTGAPQASSRWTGKVLVLNFWATWCPPCLKEMPGFMALQEEFGDRGLQFVGIAIDSPDAVREFTSSREINYPILVGDIGAVQLSKQLGNRFQGLPFSVIFDRTGAVIHAQAGELKADIILEKISALL